MITVDRLTKSFLDYRRGWVSAVNQVDFTCLPGKITGLLGPNGAGKTTTLRMLSTVLRPTSGSARVAGFDIVTEPDAVRSRIGYMSASTQLYDRMTAWELVAYFGSLYGLEGDDLATRMHGVFDWLQMQDFGEMMIGKMSTGMKQKVSIARTIIHDPPVLIFDEPTSNLDILVARAVLEKIEELRDRGKTVLFSTHSMSAVERLCDHVAILYRGRILDQDTIPNLESRYQLRGMASVLYHLVDQCDAAAKTADATATAEATPSD